MTLIEWGQQGLRLRNPLSQPIQFNSIVLRSWRSLSSITFNLNTPIIVQFEFVSVHAARVTLVKPLAAYSMQLIRSSAWGGPEATAVNGKGLCYH